MFAPYESVIVKLGIPKYIQLQANNFRPAYYVCRGNKVTRLGATMINLLAQMIFTKLVIFWYTYFTSACTNCLNVSKTYLKGMVRTCAGSLWQVGVFNTTYCMTPLRVCYGTLFFLKNGPTPTSFCLFSFFQTQILEKNCRLQRDSNSDHQNRRRARWPLDHHHGSFGMLFVRFLVYLNFIPKRNTKCSILNCF